MIPERISHYRVERLLGAGGMGEVYLALDPRLRRKVALKVLPERFTSDPERIRRFQREARAASQLNHPNIITIYEVGRDVARHYIATEYIEGQTLRDRIRAGPLGIGEMLDISTGIANALATAHEADILHRDIKPENVMLRPDGYVKVLDFGLAKLSEPDRADHDSSTSGAVMGTLLYLSPEQARGRAPDARSDIYSLAAVMYEMLTREPPILTDNFVDLAISVVTKDPQPPSRLVRGIPAELDRVVLKGLAKDPRERYQSARELLSDLQALRSQLPEGTLATPSVRFEAQPTALLGTTSAGAMARLTRRFGPRRIGGVVLIVLCAAAIAYAIARNAVVVKGPIDSIAVLPFANVAGDPSSEYLSDGLAESIIDSLSRFPRLQVLARSTAFRYKGQNVDPIAAGEELHVRGIVTGQLIARGDTIIVRASLLDVKKGTQVWGEQYNRKLSDVLAIQRDISDEITSGLRMKLNDTPAVSRRAAINPEAYQEYLRGRYALNKLTEDELKKALVHFGRAIELEPDYALAYTGVAYAYYQLSNVYMAPAEAMPRAQAAARRAVQLDDALPEGHGALALVRTWYDWDFKAGQREFQRAIDLNPNGADAHRYYGDFLVVTGQFDKAIAEKKRAEQLDPLSLGASLDVGRALFYAGRYADAEAQVRRTLDLDPNFPSAYILQAQIASAQGRTMDALRLSEKVIALAGRKPLYVSMWGYFNALAGNRDEARHALGELSASADYTLPLFMARVSAALGDRDAALRHLAKLMDERSESVVWLKVDPTLAPVRRDPRFEALVKRIGL